MGWSKGAGVGGSTGGASGCGETVGVSCAGREYAGAEAWSGRHRLG